MQERAREDGAKKMSGEDRLPEERWRRVGGCVRVIEGEKVRRDDPVEYFLPAGVGGTS